MTSLRERVRPGAAEDTAAPDGLDTPAPPICRCASSPSVAGMADAWSQSPRINAHRNTGNTFAIKILHKAYNQHHVVCPTPALGQYRTVHRLSAGVR